MCGATVQYVYVYKLSFVLFVQIIHLVRVARECVILIVNRLSFNPDIFPRWQRTFSVPNFFAVSAAVDVTVYYICVISVFFFCFVCLFYLVFLLLYLRLLLLLVWTTQWNKKQQSLWLCHRFDRVRQTINYLL